MTLEKCAEVMISHGGKLIFFDGANSEKSECYNSLSVAGVSSDSRCCKKGEIFFCKGSSFEWRYAMEAQRKGACALVIGKSEYEKLDESEKKDCKLPLILMQSEEALLKSMANCSAHIYGQPMKNVFSIAVTGTKGKSTTCAMIKNILVEQGIGCAILNEYVSRDAPRLTTPESNEIHKAAAKAVNTGVTHLIIEVSSQAQKKLRTYGIDFDVACFTNLGMDHIGEKEHSDIEDYFKCKASLFENARRAVINVGDAYGKRLCGICNDKIETVAFSNGYGIGDIYSGNRNISAYGCDIKVYRKGKKIGLPIVCEGGGHNAENALAAAAVCLSMGVSDGAIMRGIFKTRVAGRNEEIVSRDGRCAMIVDYAHNEMSFEAVIKNAGNRFAGAMITVVFGCPGDKAQCRRRGLANVCARLADRVVFCDDDGGDEGYETISREMQSYFCEEIDAMNGRLSPFAVSYIKDRRKALSHALSIAEERGGKNVILLLGKGDEDRNRVFGCDEACEKDAVTAKKAMREYDIRHGVSEAIKSLEIKKDTRVLIVLGENGKEKALRQGLGALVGRGIRVLMLCGSGIGREVAEVAFSEGVAVSIHSDDEPLEAFWGEQAIGTVSVYETKRDINRIARSLILRYKPERVVYLTEKTEIIEGATCACARLSIRALSFLKEKFTVRYASEAEFALNNGAEELAVVNGGNEGELCSYLCGGRIDGTVIGRT